MKALPHLFAKLFASPLMLHAPARSALEHGLLSHMGIGASVGVLPMQAGPVGTPGRPIEQWMEWHQDMKATKEQLRLDDVLTIIGAVAIVKIHGVIDKVLTQFEMDCYGGCDLEDVDKALAIVAADPKIRYVVLYIHSPGGSVTGTPETAQRVAHLRQTKEVHAYTSTLCCSAAYYIASQADVITAAPSAWVGSIGVYMALLDETRALEMEGLKVELIKAGRLKAMGASFKPVTDEERTFLQASVDRTWAEFKKASTALRPLAEEDMQGQAFDGASALERKLVDQTTAMNLDEYVSELLLG